MRYARIIAEVLNTPWALAPEKFAVILDLLSFRASGGEFSEEEIRARVGGAEAHREPYLVMEASGERQPFASAAQGNRGGQKMVAVIPVYGVISHRANVMDDVSGGTSVEKLTTQIRQAAANPDVTSILLDVDSPGGSVFGIGELAAEISAAREQKNIVAQVNPQAASAAYWLASQASEIAVMPSGEVGSIGVYSARRDISKLMEMRGIKTTLISAGKFKTEGSPTEPISEDERANIQSRVSAYYDAFTADVARGRNVKVSDVKNGFGEGRMVPAQEAKRAGMVDRIATMDETLARLTKRGARAASVAAAIDNPVMARAEAERAMEMISASTANGQRPTANSDFSDFSTTAQAVITEDTMENSTTAAAAAVTTIDQVREKAIAAATAEQDRCDQINSLAALHNLRPQAAGWITAGKSVGEVITDIRSRQTAAPTPGQPGAEHIDAGAAARDTSNRKGPFASFGDQLMAIANSARPGARIDERLLKISAEVPSGGSANVPSDGGFLIQTDMSADIFKRTYETGALASRCSRTGISENADSLEVPYIEENSRVDGSRWGGVRVYRANEVDTVTATKVKVGKWECRLEDLKARAYATDRLLRDASAMTSVYTEAFSNEFAFVLDDEIFRGDGVAKCLGLLNSAALVTVTKEVGQAADTVQTENIVKMWASAWARGRQNMVWFYNQELDSQLPLLNVGVGAAGQPVFMPPGGLSESPYARLYGRPLIPIEQASAPGDVGDIVLADLSQYKLIDKDGIQSAWSMHVRFLYDEMTFRATMRVNGQPMWKTSLTPYKASAGFKISPFVTLAAR